jgi:hypothetical protein
MGFPAATTTEGKDWHLDNTEKEPHSEAAEAVDDAFVGVLLLLLLQLL